MSGIQDKGGKAFILRQIKQLQILSDRLVNCKHNSYIRQEKLKIMEELLTENQKKYDLLVMSIEEIRANCPHEYQCPVKILKL